MKKMTSAGLLLAALLFGSSGAVQAQQGQRILGYYAEDGYWYPGTVASISRNTFLMRYDSGEGASLSARHVRAFDWRIGSQIECNYADEGEWYEAQITAMRGHDLQVVYLEDHEEEWTTTALCRSR